VTTGDDARAGCDLRILLALEALGARTVSDPYDGPCAIVARPIRITKHPKFGMTWDGTFLSTLGKP
jgi:hypothetical protein